MKVLEDDIVKRIERNICLIVGLENDICTAGRELKSGEVNNAVIIFVNQGLNFDDAVEKVDKLRNEKLLELHELIESALDGSRFEAELHDKLRAYIEMVTAYIKAHSTWAQNTGRYNIVSDVA